MENNQTKFVIFLEITKELNKSFNVTPTIFGSLGLARAVNWNGEIHDVDFLIPKEFLKVKWQELINVMKKLGFTLQNEHQYEFVRDDKSVAFREEDELIQLALTNPKDLKITDLNGSKFKELSAQQYLNVYTTFLQLPHRLEKRAKDQEKIQQIQEYLDNK